MGRASSAKKVARAAGLGGSRAYGARPPYLYYFAVLVLVVLGVVGIWNSREYANAKVNQQGSGAPTVGQSPPWYEGFAVDICGKLQPPFSSTKDPYGITTTGRGIITISPTVRSAAGHNATLGKFAESVGMTLNASELQVPGGKLYQTGDTCEGKPGSVYVMVWTSPTAPQPDGVLQSKKEIDLAKGYEDTCNPDCDSGVLLENDQLVTIAFVPTAKKGEVPKILEPPPSVVSALTKQVAAAATTTLPTTSTSVPTRTTLRKPATTQPTATVPATSQPATVSKGASKTAKKVTRRAEATTPAKATRASAGGAPARKKK